MRRIAFFVEGRTEVHFVERFLRDLANRDEITIDKREILGGGKSGAALTITSIDATHRASDEKFYVLIHDCVGENNVKPRLAEQHQALTAAGYEVIVGIRDVRPQYSATTLSTLRKSMKSAIDKNLAPVVFILPLEEVEAWFLAEHTHFERIAPQITVPAIVANLGFDPANDDMTQRPTPADDLAACYRLGGRSYTKRKTKRTVNALDMQLVRTTVADKMSELKKLVRIVDKFLTPIASAEVQAAPGASAAAPVE
ncbi:DUF4276 family protein [Paraburkholderia guartelaensis]|nr:DUF4276 family protein [Paraburkholderia guartelaensis]